MSPTQFLYDRPLLVIYIIYVYLLRFKEENRQHYDTPDKQEQHSKTALTADRCFRPRITMVLEQMQLFVPCYFPQNSRPWLHSTLFCEKKFLVRYSEADPFARHFSNVSFK